jgi:hypothetical protein
MVHIQPVVHLKSQFNSRYELLRVCTGHADTPSQRMMWALRTLRKCGTSAPLAVATAEAPAPIFAKVEKFGTGQRVLKILEPKWLVLHRRIK